MTSRRKTLSLYFIPENWNQPNWQRERNQILMALFELLVKSWPCTFHWTNQWFSFSVQVHLCRVSATCCRQVPVSSSIPCSSSAGSQTLSHSCSSLVHGLLPIAQGKRYPQAQSPQLLFHFSSIVTSITVGLSSSLYFLMSTGIWVSTALDSVSSGLLWD